MISKVSYHFLICYIVLWQYEVNLDSKHCSFNAHHFFAFFTLSKKTFDLLCNEETSGLELAYESCQTY